MLRAELLAKLGSSDRAYLDTLAAGYTLVFLNMRTVSRTAHVRRVVQLRRTDRIADTRSTVADADDLVFAVDIRNLMHEAMTLRALEDLHCFVICDIASRSAVHAVFCKIPYTDAELAVDFTGTLTAHCLLLAACALTDRILVILIQPVAQMFD